MHLVMHQISGPIIRFAHLLKLFKSLVHSIVAKLFFRETPASAELFFGFLVVFDVESVPVGLLHGVLEKLVKSAHACLTLILLFPQFLCSPV